jgi:hypothetical protein
MKPVDTLIDFVTGREVPDIGAEANRQAFERILVEQKGFSKEDIEVDVPLNLVVAGKPYNSRVDLVVSAGGRRMMAVKCAAGSLGSREREILAAARLLEDCQIPVSVVTDGRNGVVLDTLSGEKTGEGIDAIPSKEALLEMSEEKEPVAFPEKRVEREKLIFRTYDLENVNVQRNETNPLKDGKR